MSDPSLLEIYDRVCDLAERGPLAIAQRHFVERDGKLIYQPKRPAFMTKDKPDPVLRCTVCNTPLQEHGPELVCPQDGHRYIVKEGELIDAPRVGYGRGPDGVPDRRHYPPLDGGISRRSARPSNMVPRADEPVPQPVPYR